MNDVVLLDVLYHLRFFYPVNTLFDVNEYLEIFPSCSYRTETNEEGKVAC